MLNTPSNSVSAGVKAKFLKHSLLCPRHRDAHKIHSLSNRIPHNTALECTCRTFITLSTYMYRPRQARVCAPTCLRLDPHYSYPQSLRPAGCPTSLFESLLVPDGVAAHCSLSAPDTVRVWTEGVCPLGLHGEGSCGERLDNPPDPLSAIPIGALERAGKFNPGSQPSFFERDLRLSVFDIKLL